jgi:hypothetical protein
MKRLRKIALGMLAIAACYTSIDVFAACTVPNVLANGQVADASEVMDNFNAVASCADGAVTPSGSPSSGAIAVFSGGKTVSAGNLTGDVATSGGTATTLAATGVSPGTYINPTIVLDSKGRVTAATNGVAGGGGGVGWTELTLVNPGAETGNVSGWTMAGGGFTATQVDPSGHIVTPIVGSYEFTATANANPKMSQNIDLSTFSTQIDAGTVSAMLEAYVADTYATGESPYIYIEFRDGVGNLRATAITSMPIRSLGAGNWRFLSVTGRIPPLTRSMSLFLWANRNEGTNNNVSFDEVRAFLSGY